MARDGHITLNFSQDFLARLRTYAHEHDMKVNAVVRQAFHLLEDHPELVRAQKKEQSDDYYR